MKKEVFILKIMFGRINCLEPCVMLLYDNSMLLMETIPGMCQEYLVIKSGDLQ